MFTTQVEYISIVEGFKEALWLKGLIDELGIDSLDLTIYCDSQSAIHLMKNPTLHERSKHIDVKYHFIREVIEQSTVKVEKIPTKIMQRMS